MVKLRERFGRKGRLKTHSYTVCTHRLYVFWVFHFVHVFYAALLFLTLDHLDQASNLVNWIILVWRFTICIWNSHQRLPVYSASACVFTTGLLTPHCRSAWVTRVTHSWFTYAGALLCVNIVFFISKWACAPMNMLYLHMRFFSSFFFTS